MMEDRSGQSFNPAHSDDEELKKQADLLEKANSEVTKTLQEIIDSGFQPCPKVIEKDFSQVHNPTHAEYDSEEEEPMDDELEKGNEDYIDNLFDAAGIILEVYNESGVFKQPAEVEIYGELGYKLCTIRAKLVRQMGADGGQYPVINFEVFPEENREVEVRYRT